MSLECGACGAELKDAYLCNRDTDGLKRDLLLVALAAKSLRITHLRQDVHPTERQGKPQKAKYTPLPWSEVARGVLDDLRTLLYRYCTPADVSEPLEQTAMNLATGTGWIRQREDAGQLATGLTDILKRTEACTDRREEAWNYGGCDTCGTVLEALVDAKRVTCPQCNTSYDAEKLRARQWETVNGALVSQAEAALLLQSRGVATKDSARKLINKWVERKLILPREDGKVLFGDVYERWVKGEAMRRKKAVRSAQVRSAA